MQSSAKEETVKTLSNDMIIHGGVETKITGPVAYDVTFNVGGQNILSITPAGELKPGAGLSPDAATKKLAAHLVEHWGTAYGQKLRMAQDAEREAQVTIREQKKLIAMQEEEISRHKHTTDIVSSLASGYVGLDNDNIKIIADNEWHQLCKDIRTMAASCLSQDPAKGRRKRSKGKAKS
jgi:hypothetical protein